ncbi:MAG: hypothetical protein L6R38_003292 [Xanthoria sp. 2 TBL-2021]|nr:MAG: hypothetical protein L6R38_003292 [Xanthoria sp. 2 TBL-2021]
MSLVMQGVTGTPRASETNVPLTRQRLATNASELDTNTPEAEKLVSSGATNTLVAPDALLLLNAFFDQLLYSILVGSRSTSIAALRPPGHKQRVADCRLGWTKLERRSKFPTPLITYDVYGLRQVGVVKLIASLGRFQATMNLLSSSPAGWQRYNLDSYAILT